MPSKFLNISTDNTLGGSSPSDTAVPSQKAVKEYCDQHGGGTVDWTTISGYDATQVQIIVNDHGTVKWVTAGYIE